jgi:tetratricopeptide (TPR) repeat protein
LLAPSGDETQFPVPGETVGEFLLIAELGRGAHGRVFLARQHLLGGREVALKIVRRHNGEHLCLARLQHTHIVPLYAAVDEVSRGLHVLCMPYFAGASLARLLEALRALSPKERSGRSLMTTLDQISQEDTPAAAARPHHAAARRFLETASHSEAVCWIGACLADALHYAHELIAADGQPMLLDFHLARKPMRREEISSEGIGGTLAYMSPEQHAAWSSLRQRRQPPHDVDTRSDIYSLGVVLWEGLSGAVPNEPGQLPLEKLLEARVSPGLADIVGKCLQPLATERYASMKDLAGDLRRHLTNLPLLGVRNRSLRERWQKWRRRRPHSIAIGVMMVSLVVALAAVCLGGIAQVRARAKMAETALRDGQLQMSQGEWEGASRTLDRGLAVARGLPWHDDLATELRHEAGQVVLARRALKAAATRRTLHQLADQIRSFGGANAGTAITAPALEPACLLFWENRWQIIAKLVGPNERLVDAGAKADLLDLAIFLADMQDDLAARPLHDHSKSVEILNQALALVGPSPALDTELERRDANVNRTERVPQTAWECLAVGRARFKEGQFSRAASYFEEAVRLEPHGLWPNFLHGQCCYRQGRYTEAAMAFSICIGADPDSWGCFHNRSMAFAALEQFRLALADCERALQLEPDAVEPHLQRALLRVHLGDFAGAYTDALATASLAVGKRPLTSLSEKKDQTAPGSSSAQR